MIGGSRLSAYQTGQARHISGVSASGDRLVIRLAHPDAALPHRLALKFFCAVPDNAPARENDMLPMAGPYYIHSYSKGKQVVLARNPNYHGHRPAQLNTIDITFGERPSTSIARVIAGTEDYYAAPAFSADVMSPTEDARLRARYGAGAAHQRYFVNPSTLVSYLAFNTARGPFANARLRRAVNFAIDRKAIGAQQGILGPSLPTDQYLPPGVPGFRNAPIYPLGGDPATALRLAGRGQRHVTLIAVNFPPFPQQAQIVQANLAKIGIDVDIKTLSTPQLFKRVVDTHATWDLATVGWTPDLPDPSNVLNPLLRGNRLPPALNANFAHFDDPAYNRRLDDAARLTGPSRDTAYAKLDADLIGKAAPMAAIGVWLNRDLFSARIGCQNLPTALRHRPRRPLRQTPVNAHARPRDIASSACCDHRENPRIPLRDTPASVRPADQTLAWAGVKRSSPRTLSRLSLRTRTRHPPARNQPSPRACIRGKQVTLARSRSMRLSGVRLAALTVATGPKREHGW